MKIQENRSTLWCHLSVSFGHEIRTNRMPDLCVVFGCYNESDPENGIALHRIPFFNPQSVWEGGKQWIHFVKWPWAHCSLSWSAGNIFTKTSIASSNLDVHLQNQFIFSFFFTQAMVIKKGYSLQSYAIFWVPFVAPSKNNTQKRAFCKGRMQSLTINFINVLWANETLRWCHKVS